MKLKKILIMGLPGSGKTTLASKLVPLINAKWLNADEVRKKNNDWDFSAEGRKRQAIRMNKLAAVLLDQGFNVVADFVCPTPEYRKLFDPDHVIWVNTIEKSKFEAPMLSTPWLSPFGPLIIDFSKEVLCTHVLK